MKDKDYIKELFSEKLSNHEVPVRSDLWSGIQSQLGNTASTTLVAKGISSSLKWMIGIASSVAVIGTTVWVVSTPEENKKQQLVRIDDHNGDAIINEESKSGVNFGVTNKPKMSSTESQSTHVVPPAELSSNNYLDEWISREKQLYNLDNTNKQITPPVEENKRMVVNSDLTDTKTTVINANVSPDPVENSTFEDGKIEEFVNVFTPNGDGMNDYFFLQSSNLKEFTIRIFNEKDQLVFQSNDKDFKWMGQDLSGNMVDSGNYAYVIFATDLNGKRIKLFKNLTIK